MAHETVVLLSGGLDSAVLMAALPPTHLALTFDYGQRPRDIELESAAVIAKRHEAEHLVMKIDPAVFAGAALAGGKPVPLFASLDEVPDGIPDVYVPARNTVFLAHAAALAASRGIHTVALGVTAEDASFPDCTRRYLDAFNDMLWYGTPGSVRVEAPLLRMTKPQVVSLGRELGVDFEITTSCYNGTSCGECEACLRRERALCTT